MENNELIRYEAGLLKRVGNAISVTNKLLATTEFQLIPYRKKDKWGFCTIDKKIKINCKYDRTFPYTEGLSAFILNNKYGYINKNDESIIDAKYDRAGEFSKGFAIIEQNKKL